MTSGSVAQWAQTSEAGSRWQLRFMRGVALRAPGWLTAPLIWMISFVFACQTRRPSTRASMVYLERLLGRPALFAERHRHARTFAHVFLDRARLLAGGLEAFRIDVQGQQLIERAHAAGRGGVLLGAHFGSFEALRAFDRSLPGLRVYYLMYPDHAPASTALLNELNREVAERIISLQDSQQAMLKVFEVLDRGDFVAFLGDRMPDRSIRGQVGVPFLGDSIRLPTSPYIAAIAARVPLFLCIAPRVGKDQYAIEFSMLYDGGRVGRLDRRRVIDALAHDYAGALEAMCRRYPYNWFNFFDIWRD